MIPPATYRTRTGKTGVVCTCGRRALLTPTSHIYRHSPITGRDWCPMGGTQVGGAA